MGDDLQTLPKHLRASRRYVVVSLYGPPVSFGAFLGAVQDAIEVDAWVMQDLYDREAGRGVVRVRKDAVTELRAALALIQDVEGDAVTVVVEGVTGTVKSARDNYLEA